MKFHYYCSNCKDFNTLLHFRVRKNSNKMLILPVIKK